NQCCCLHCMRRSATRQIPDSKLLPRSIYYVLPQNSDDLQRSLCRVQCRQTLAVAARRDNFRIRCRQSAVSVCVVIVCVFCQLKQMKELEQEKDSLLAGLDVLERAREWYQTQIHNITETQRHIGQSHHSTEFLAESCQSQLDVVLPKLQDVTRCLCDLLSFSGKVRIKPPFTLIYYCCAEMSLAFSRCVCHLSLQEVTEKSERITQLEQEKTALIKQLFEARASSAHNSSALDSTFI
uniref:Suppressor APC domain containing 2 n=1 Tax=Sinocyclocheilus anshuiensis TaxID=1608454 RepID=A0A671RAG0_9TELE